MSAPWTVFFCVLLMTGKFSWGYKSPNNVCKTFPDYKTLATNKNCWYNPDANSSPALIAKRTGYPLEKYKITTEDGYILTLYRIPHNRTDPNSKRQPVLLQHGIGATAIFWMLQGQHSLAFFLADNGYDVWMPTCRGAGSSQQHKFLTTDNPEYWNFSFHEMAIYDMPAIIDQISRTTNQVGNIIFIGHSMGTSISYIYSTVRKDHADRHLKALVSLSPVAFMKNIKGLYKVLAPLAPIITHIIKQFGLHAIGHLSMFRLVLKMLCGMYTGLISCQVVTILATGLSLEQVRPDIFPVFLSYFPAATAVKTLNHFSQSIVSGGKFRYFDYGPENMAVYNSTMPPLYEVEKISMPVHLFVGKQDFISPLEDVDILYEKLKLAESGSKVKKYYFNFAHNDFYMGKNFKYYYDVLLGVIKKESTTDKT